MTGVMRQLRPALAGDIHDVDVLPARSARPVFTVPCKGKELAVGRPRRRSGIAPISQSLHVGAVRIHDVNLRQPCAPAYPGNLRIRLWIPDRRHIRSTESSDAMQSTAAGVSCINSESPS